MADRDRLNTAQLVLVEGIVAARPDGMTRPELEVALEQAGHHVAWRTLLRRLAALPAQGRVVASGVGRGRRYLPGPPSAEAASKLKQVRSAAEL